MKLFVSLVVALTIFFSFSPSNAWAQAVDKVPYRLLALQFNTNSEVFTTTNPDLAGTPLTLTSATGVTPANGRVMVSIGAGFTPPNTLTVFYWQFDDVTPAKAGWRREGADDDSYSVVIDATYTSVVFSGPPNTPFLIMSENAITGDVYINAKAHSLNPNSATGYPLQ